MKKQQIKSQNTRNKILQAAKELFAEKGYDAVAVADIVERAECSVGAFYGHFKSKEILASKIWLDVTTGIMSESVEKGSRIKDREAFVDYLIERSKIASQDPLMNSLYSHCHISIEDRKELSAYASRYLGMIRNALFDYAPEASEDALWTYASIIHSLLNAHAQQDDNPTSYFRFSDKVVRQAILALMDVCREKGMV